MLGTVIGAVDVTPKRLKASERERGINTNECNEVLCGTLRHRVGMFLSG